MDTYHQLLASIRRSKRLVAQANELEEWIYFAGPQFRLMRHLVKLLAALTNDRLRSKRVGTPNQIAFTAEIDKLLGQIRRRYPSQRRVVTSDDWRVLPTLEERPLRPKLEKSITSEDEAAEVHQMMEACYELADAGAFAAVRHCKLDVCSKFFFAFRPNKRFCSDECQRTLYDRSPVRRERNKRAVLEHYYRAHPFAKPRTSAGSSARRKTVRKRPPKIGGRT